MGVRGFQNGKMPKSLTLPAGHLQWPCRQNAIFWVQKWPPSRPLFSNSGLNRSGRSQKGVQKWVQGWQTPQGGQKSTPCQCRRSKMGRFLTPFWPLFYIPTCQKYEGKEPNKYPKGVKKVGQKGVKKRPKMGPNARFWEIKKWHFCPHFLIYKVSVKKGVHFFPKRVKTRTHLILSLMSFCKKTWSVLTWYHSQSAGNWSQEGPKMTQKCQKWPDFDPFLIPLLFKTVR